MIFYLTIKPDKELTHVPFIDAIDITLNGKEIHASWDETDACLEKNGTVDYRFKGVSFNDGDDENGEMTEDYYANGTVKRDSVVTVNKDFWWMEDDDAEEFNFDIEHFEILDYDEDKKEEVRLVVIGKE